MTECPVCGADIEKASDTVLGELLECSDCGTELEVTNLNPFNVEEAPGFLDDVNNPNSIVKVISQSELEKREEQVDGRMKRKMKALIKLFESGKTSVYICDGRIKKPITNALNSEGTIIQ